MIKPYAPIFWMGEGNKVIILDEGYMGNTKEEAIAFGVASSTFLYNYELDFSGEVCYTELTTVVPCTIADSNNNSIEVGVMEGSKDFNKLNKSKKFINPHIVARFNMNNDVFFNMKVVIGQDLRPYVILDVNGKDHIFSSQDFRDFCTDGLYVAEASEQEAFLWDVAGKMGYNESEKLEYIQSVRYARENFRERLNEERELEAKTDELEQSLKEKLSDPEEGLQDEEKPADEEKPNSD